MKSMVALILARKRRFALIRAVRSVVFDPGVKIIAQKKKAGDAPAAAAAAPVEEKPEKNGTAKAEKPEKADKEKAKADKVAAKAAKLSLHDEEEDGDEAPKADA